MTPEEKFTRLIGEITSAIAGRPLDTQLESELNARFPPDGPYVASIAQACGEAIAAGWMCNRENGGIRYGRVAKPGPVTHDFSIDVVEMPALAGPHHRHPNGEIDLIMPLEAGARFDDRPGGWLWTRSSALSAAEGSDRIHEGLRPPRTRAGAGSRACRRNNDPGPQEESADADARHTVRCR